MLTIVEEYTSRIDRAWQQIRRWAPTAAARGGLSDPDPNTGERWDTGQLLAHTAEMLPYWLVQIRGLIATGGGRPFGRTASDGARSAAIERDRGQPMEVLLARIEAGVADLRDFLSSLEEKNLAIVGVHSTLGEMDVPQILEHFLVEHLEDHAEQMEGLAGAARP